jgi:glycosyl transferase family 25
MFKSYIITLSKISSSAESAGKLQQDLSKIGIAAELFEGTYGSEAIKLIQSEKRFVHGYPVPGNDKYYFKQLRPGVQGCFLSHYRLWKRCLELAEPILIFEDDVIIYRPLIPVEFLDVLVICLGAVKRRRYEHYLYNPSGTASARLYDNATMPGACGYVIKPEAAEKLVKTYENSYLAADNSICQPLVKIQIHNHLIGEANTNKKSLTKSLGFWHQYDLDQ